MFAYFYFYINKHTINTLISKDVFAEAINYYRGDYQKAGAGLDMNTSTVPSLSTHLGNYAKDLFNGNIASTVTNTAFNLLPANTTPNILAQGFRYDMLNRLTDTYAETQAEGFAAYKTNGSGNDAYSLHMSYDANGNISTLVRNSMNAGIKMDDMTYTYPNTVVNHYGVTKKTTNKLGHVADAAGDLADIADIVNQSAGNYTYDAKGRIISDTKSDIQLIEWTAYDKVKKITHTAASGKPNVEFTYDNKQQRQTKKAGSVTTVYSYDANGILLATYEQNATNYKLLDFGIYGLSRIGSYAENLVLSNIPNPISNVSSKLRFEIADHLGNVRAVLQGSKNANNTAQITSLTDYDPYGFNFQNRNFLSETNRYGFQGQERDQEYLGGNAISFNYRIEDPRIGRMFSTDAYSNRFSERSPYSFANNNPILNIEYDGNWDIEVHTYKNREKYGYGIAIVKDRFGKEVYRFTIRAEGTGGRNRLKKNADTPTGVYDIPDKDMWKSGGSRESYGKNPRLVLDGTSGEIADSKRGNIRIHGGRQETYDEKTKTWAPVKNPKLKKTNGCLRAYDEDVEMLKDVTDALKNNDPEEVGGKFTIIDDLIEKDGNFIIPEKTSTTNNLIDDQTENRGPNIKPFIAVPISTYVQPESTFQLINFFNGLNVGGGGNSGGSSSGGGDAPSNPKFSPSTRNP